MKESSETLVTDLDPARFLKSKKRGPDIAAILEEKYFEDSRSPLHVTDKLRDEFEDKDKDFFIDQQAKQDVHLGHEIEHKYREMVDSGEIANRVD